MTEERAPAVGDRAPDFTLPSADGTPVRLGDLLAKKAVVLYFYPRDETAICTKEACSFRDAYQDFIDAGAEVVGVSRDDAASHARFASGHRLPFRLLSDTNGAIHAQYGVRKRLGGLLQDRISYVIDREGIIRLAFSSQLRFDAHVKEALRVVRALAATTAG